MNTSWRMFKQSLLDSLFQTIWTPLTSREIFTKPFPSIFSTFSLSAEPRTDDSKANKMSSWANRKTPNHDFPQSNCHCLSVLFMVWYILLPNVLQMAFKRSRILIKLFYIVIKRTSKMLNRFYLNVNQIVYYKFPNIRIKQLA